MKIPSYKNTLNFGSTMSAAFSVLSVAVLIFVATAVISPSKTLAFEAVQIIDPFCLWSGCNEDDPDTVNNTYTNSNNTNSNINSPGAVVNNSGNTGGSYYPDYDYDYNDYPDYGNLGVSCYATPTHVDEGERVTWYANAYGGTGSYHYNWDGDDNLDGSGRSITKRYNDGGSKRASVRVTSGNQTVNRECDNVVYVDEDNYYDDDDYDYDYDDDYDSLSVSCRANTSFIIAGDSVEWVAYVSGGRGGYRYDWDGTDNLNDTDRVASKRYHNTGTKYARVRVTSSGHSVTRECDFPVTVGLSSRNDNQYTYGGSIQAACFADVRSARIGAPVTWAVEATGGAGSYTYYWSGSEGLTGSASRVATAYSTAGTKSASVTINSGGQNTTISCGNTVSVGNGGGSTVTPKDDSKDDEKDGSLSASTFFSLGSVPWGWVAILVILILFSMVMYLLYNKNKV
jgi:hypothetical protein